MVNIKSLMITFVQTALGLTFLPVVIDISDGAKTGNVIKDSLLGILPLLFVVMLLMLWFIVYNVKEDNF